MIVTVHQSTSVPSFNCLQNSAVNGAQYCQGRTCKWGNTPSTTIKHACKAPIGPDIPRKSCLTWPWTNQTHSYSVTSTPFCSVRRQSFKSHGCHHTTTYCSSDAQYISCCTEPFAAFERPSEFAVLFRCSHFYSFSPAALLQGGGAVCGKKSVSSLPYTPSIPFE